MHISQSLVRSLTEEVLLEAAQRLRAAKTLIIPPTVFIFKNGKILYEKPLPEDAEEVKQRIKDIINTDKSEPDVYVLVANVKTQIDNKKQDNAIMVHGASIEWGRSILLPISLTKKKREVKLGDPILLEENEVSFFDDIWLDKILFN